MRFLIFGLGSIAKKHITALRSLDSAHEIIALRSSRDAETVDGVRNIYDISELDKSIDAALICSPTVYHKDAISQALNLECPLFIEKPVLQNLDGAEDLIAEIQELHISTYTACHLRFHPCLQFLKDNIGSKNVQEVNVYCGSYMPEWQPDRNWKESFRIDPEKGGGVHLELIHELDYVSWIFGIPTAISSCVRSVSSLQIEASDYANYVAEYKSFTANVIVNYYRRDAKRTCEVVFEDTTWQIDLLNFCITEGDTIIFESPHTSVADVYKAQLQYFIDCITKDIVPMNSIEESVQTLTLALS